MILFRIKNGIFSKDLAVDYATKNNIEYELIEPQKGKLLKNHILIIL